MISHLNNNTLENLSIALMREIFAYKHKHKAKVSDVLLFKFSAIISLLRQ